MKYLMTLFLIVTFTGPFQAQACDRRFTVAVPERMFLGPDFRAIRDAIAQVDDGSANTCLEFHGVRHWPNEAQTLVETGEFGAALVPLSSVAEKDPLFLPLVQGYRFTDAQALQAEFDALIADEDNGKKVEFLGLVIGEPAFPSFRAETFKSGPEFSSDFEVIWKPGANREINADAVLSTPVQFGTSALIANSNVLADLDVHDRKSLQTLVGRITASTAVGSDEKAADFLAQARSKGMQVFDLADADRVTLLQEIGTLVSREGTTPIRWIQQCTAGTCGCAGTNVCSSQCCASQ